jgi:NAD(P)-dependent dehydrogenase (short-subunit alcohol dehydrogenase family)
MQGALDSFRPNLFKDKYILVTGGSSGIGLAIAQGFAGLGGSVIALGNSEAKLATAKNEGENKKIRFERVDVRDPAAIKTFGAGLDRLRRARQLCRYRSTRSRV